MKITLSRVLGLTAFCGLSCLSASADALEIRESNASIVIQAGAIPVLTYEKAEMAPPPGVDDAYRRSGFIHPLHTPKGAVVTSIHAPDHRHHMGLWHAWVNTEFRGEKVDFWNLKARTGLVRFAGSQDLNQSNNSVGFTVRQEQVALGNGLDDADEVVLRETLSVSVAQTGNANVIDYAVTQRNITDAVLKLPAYRYGGGITFRAPDAWDEGNADYLTSAGLDRKQGHATRGRWSMMYGPSEYGEAAVVIMGHPGNHDAPQRMRIWPEGKVFFNYAPTQEFDWQIDPNEEILLRYRVLVFDGRPSVVEIENRWRAYVKTDHD
jgi:hypothetical protein